MDANLRHIQPNDLHVSHTIVNSPLESSQLPRSQIKSDVYDRAC